jgi:hypothetical protein
MKFVSTRRGVVDLAGNLLGQPDEGSTTRKVPQGTFQGQPVMGFWKAVRTGLVSVEPLSVGPKFCGCCYGWQDVTLQWMGE